MHRAKGLEFFAVAIPFVSDGAFPPPGALKSAVDLADREDIVTQYRSLPHVAASRGRNPLEFHGLGHQQAFLATATSND
jgi:superfamily I DNA/RNA helicase